MSAAHLCGRRQTIVSIVFHLPVFVHDVPRHTGTQPPAVHSASWDSHPSEDLSEAPSFAATVLSRSALGLDASIIIAPAFHGFRYGCAVPSESWRLRILLYACLSERPLMWLALSGGRRNVKAVLNYSLVKELRKKLSSLVSARKTGFEHPVNSKS